MGVEEQVNDQCQRNCEGFSGCAFCDKDTGTSMELKSEGWRGMNALCAGWIAVACMKWNAGALEKTREAGSFSAHE